MKLSPFVWSIQQSSHNHNTCPSLSGTFNDWAITTIPDLDLHTQTDTTQNDDQESWGWFHRDNEASLEMIKQTF